MTRLEDRQTLAAVVDEARADGARLGPACALAGIDPRTLQRWRASDGLARGDRRPEAVRALAAHALSPAERARIVGVAMPTCRRHGLSPLWPMKAATWPARPAFTRGCATPAR